MDHLRYARRILDVQDEDNDAPDEMFDLSEYIDLYQAIREIGTRHPLSVVQAKKIARRFGNEDLVDALVAEARAAVVRHNGADYLIPLSRV